MEVRNNRKSLLSAGKKIAFNLKLYIQTYYLSRMRVRQKQSWANTNERVNPPKTLTGGNFKSQVNKYCLREIIQSNGKYSKKEGLKCKKKMGNLYIILKT